MHDCGTSALCGPRGGFAGLDLVLQLLQVLLSLRFSTMARLPPKGVMPGQTAVPRSISAISTFSFVRDLHSANIPSFPRPDLYDLLEQLFELRVFFGHRLPLCGLACAGAGVVERWPFAWVVFVTGILFGLVASSRIRV